MKTEKQEKSESKMVAESRRTEDRKKHRDGRAFATHSVSQTRFEVLQFGLLKI